MSVQTYNDFIITKEDFMKEYESDHFDDSEVQANIVGVCKFIWRYVRFNGRPSWGGSWAQEALNGNLSTEQLDALREASELQLAYELKSGKFRQTSGYDANTHQIVDFSSLVIDSMAKQCLAHAGFLYRGLF